MHSIALDRQEKQKGSFMEQQVVIMRALLRTCSDLLCGSTDRPLYWFCPSVRPFVHPVWALKISL